MGTDQEIAALEGKQRKPPLEFGPTSWRFSFFGNKGFTGKGIFRIFTGSQEIRQESEEFDIDEQFSSRSLLAGFKRRCQRLFQTRKRIGNISMIGFTRRR